MGIIINNVDIGSLPATNTNDNTRTNYTLIQVLNGAINALSNNTFTSESTDYTASAGDVVEVTTAANAVNITLPLAPLVGGTVSVTKVDNGSGQINILGNGKLINEDTEDVIKFQFTFVSYRYNGTNWIKI